MNAMIAEAITTIVIALVGLAATWATLYINKIKARVTAQISQMQDAKQRDLVQAAFAQLDELAGKTVTALEQTIAKTLRKAVKEGRADPDALQELGHRAYNDIMDQLKPEYLHVIMDNIGNTKQYVMNLIENKVFEVKAAGQP